MIRDRLTLYQSLGGYTRNRQGVTRMRLAICALQTKTSSLESAGQCFFAYNSTTLSKTTIYLKIRGVEQLNGSFGTCHESREHRKHLSYPHVREHVEGRLQGLWPAFSNLISLTLLSFPSII
jgi:hypothetical protein